MAQTLTFETVFESSDGGESVFELRSTVGELHSLYTAGILQVGNIRPDHSLVTLKSGKTRFKRTSDRQKRWTEQASRGQGIFGNLSWNADPDHNDIEFDEDAGRLTISGKDGKNPILRTPDSATRHRGIIDAVEAPMRTVDLDRLVSVRLWMVPADVEAHPGELTESAVFDSYNQDGQPVNATVAKNAFQRDDLERLVHKFLYTSPHLGLDNVETIQNSVSRESSKLAAYNTFYTAFKDGWTHDVEDPQAWQEQLSWLIEYWDALAAAVPELRRVSLAQRKEFRRDSVAGAATLLHAYVRLADWMRTEGLDPAVLSVLKDRKVTLHQDGLRTAASPVTGEQEPLYKEGDTLPFFSPDNPQWSAVGVVVAKTAKDGATSAEVRNAFQTRGAAAKVLIGEVLPAAVETKQEAVHRLCDLLGITRLSLGAGGTTPGALFDALALKAGVDTGPAPQVGRRVAEKAGLQWGPDFDSAGSTVTLQGLRVLMTAVQNLP